MLVLVGVKMTLVDVYKIPALVSPGVVAALLALSIVASIVASKESVAPEDMDLAA